MTLRTEIQRKAIHMFSGLVPLGYGIWPDKRWALVFLGMGLVGLFILERFRHGDNRLGRFFRRAFQPILREKEMAAESATDASAEKPKWLGSTYYFLSSFIVILVFPPPVAVLSLLYLAVGDTSASMVGMTWGRTRIGSKSLEGSLAFVVSCSLIAAIAWWLAPSDYPLLAGLAGALIATLVELFITNIDDNFTIPFGAGGGILLTKMLMGG